ncbi:hypothetical protein [Halorarum halobium]|uniref:hypothetical protein n=1 Tax=Halorarum halobium TaxID=3075121 RepID=UPI0028AC3CE5|nr:hypothetical protein [Halobaculum sp. XH14]
MDRRSFLAAALAGVAGCSDGSGGARTVAPDLRGTPAPTPSPTAEPTASAPPTGGSRTVLLANDTHHALETQLEVVSDGETVLRADPRLAPAMTAHRFDVLPADRSYEAAVTTSAGHARAFEWEPGRRGSALRIGFGDDVSVREAFDIDASTRLLTGDTGVIRDGPADTWFPLVLDNPGEVTPARVAFSNGDGFGGVTLDVPPRSRVRLPVTVPADEVEVAATVGGRDASATWHPRADGPLPLLVDPPRFVCDTLFRSLRVENRTVTDWAAEVIVRADGRTAFTRRTNVEPGAIRAFRAVVPPAGEHVVRIESGGVWAHYELPDCPPVGPVVLAVDDEGIDVAARSVEADDGATMTATEPTDEPATATENGTADGG